MRKLELMADIDDVIFPLIDGIHAVAQEVGLHDGSEPPHNWHGWEQYNCSEEAYWDLWVKFSANNGYLTTPPYPGAAEALRDLHFDGHNIHLVTKRGFFDNGSDVKKWTRQWLEEFGIPHRTLTFTQDKVGAQDELGVMFDLAIDDHPGNYTALADDGVNVWLHNQPHNALFDAEFRVSGIPEWAQIARRLVRA